MKKIKHLVIVEAGKTAFMTKWFNSAKKAEAFADELWKLTVIFSPVCELEIITNILEKENYMSYKFYGDVRSFPLSDYEISNGIYVVSVIQIDTTKFCLKTFIKERQNCSDILSEADYSATYKCYEVPSHYRIAN